MALVKCPECGKENVSDSAEMCPECGYNVKEHFLKIEQEENEKRIKKELEEKKIQEEKEQKKREKEKEELELSKIPTPLPPPSKNIARIAIAVIAIGGIFLTIASLFLVSEPSIFGAIVTLVVTIFLICFMKGRYDSYVKEYEKAMRDIDKYKRDELRRKKEEEKRSREHQERLMDEILSKKDKVKCPYCGSYNISKIGNISRGVSVGMLGLASSKIGKQWHCDHCGSDF